MKHITENPMLTLEDLSGNAPFLVGISITLLLDVPDHEALVS
jgi:hypothetical protein